MKERYTLEDSELFNIDCREFLKEKPEFINLVITSPPYNNGIEYDVYNDKRDYLDYLDFIYQCFESVYKCMVKNSMLCVNIGRNYNINIPSHFNHIFEEIGFKFYCSIIWQKPVGSAVPSAICKEGFPRYQPYCVTEDILVYYTKGFLPNFIPNKEIMRLRQQFLSNVWKIQPEFSPQHPAIMPKQLAYNLITFFSKEGDVVFDPFAGLGTVVITAKENKRIGIGTEISKEYCRIGNLQLKQFLLF